MITLAITSALRAVRGWLLSSIYLCSSIIKTRSGRNGARGVIFNRTQLSCCFGMALALPCAGILGSFVNLLDMQSCITHSVCLMKLDMELDSAWLKNSSTSD
mmetsp:Transcript_40030/g.83737  ORF Transcript_40030/g.83737 Transcript_40030/m.83737 type:complete len:102 (-) Transcript_40030:64-369(-)